jgi:hypothetical protein
MIQTLIKNWWLLALCGVLDALYAVVNLFTQDPDGSPTLRKYLSKGTALLLCKFAVAAGVSTIAAGVWRSTTGKSWLLALHGLALSVFGALGLICVFWAIRMSFRPFALLLVVMAMSIGTFALTTARTLLSDVPDKWFVSLAGAASVGFALAFLALSWIEHVQPESFQVWMSSYFCFSAFCMLGLALRLHSLGHSESGPRENLPRLGNPEHVH